MLRDAAPTPCAVISCMCCTSLMCCKRPQEAGCSPCSHVKGFSWLVTTALSCCYAA